MQCIIEAYGTARYGEINPSKSFLYNALIFSAVFSIVTFPFLFAVMFGDCGHAVMMLCAALVLIFFEKKLQSFELNEVSPFLNVFVTSRLLKCFSLAVMCYFSCQCFLFSLVFFIMMWVFCICCSNISDLWTGSKFASYCLVLQCKHVKLWKNCPRYLNWSRLLLKFTLVYEFGIDPTWKGADNELYFYNSFKMKLSVVLGVVQMTVGICLSLLNHIHFKNWLSVFFEFIPQVYIYPFSCNTGRFFSWLCCLVIWLFSFS